MTLKERLLADERIVRALDDFQRAILDRYPNATFQLSFGGEPEGVYLEPIVDADLFDVLDLIRDRLYEVQVDEYLPVYVVPLQPMAVAAGPR